MNSKFLVLSTFPSQSQRVNVNRVIPEEVAPHTFYCGTWIQTVGVVTLINGWRRGVFLSKIFFRVCFTLSCRRIVVFCPGVPYLFESCTAGVSARRLCALFVGFSCCQFILQLFLGTFIYFGLSFS